MYLGQAGVATIRGTVTCTGAFSTGSVEIEAREKVGRKILRASGYVDLEACSETGTTWEAEMSSSDGRLGPGRLAVTAYGSACGAIECADTSVERTVKLQR
jgi:hypothetical protein